MASLLKQITGDADPEVMLWHRRISRGISLRDKESPRWDKNIQYDDLHHWDGKEAEGDEVTVNKVGSYVESRLAAICFKNPGASVRPVRNADYNDTIDFGDGVSMPRHVVVENTLNFVTSHPSFGFVDTLERFARAGLLSYGAIKVGYKNEFEYIPVKEDDQEIELAPNGMPDYLNSGYLIDESTGDPVRDDDGRLIKRSADPTSELWFCDWVSPYDLIIDPDGENDFRKHSWVAMEMTCSLADVKKNKLFKNTKNLKATGCVTFNSEDGESEQKPIEAADLESMFPDPDMREEEETVRLFEIFDFDNKRLIVMAEGHGKLLRDDPVPDGIDHSPYVFFRPNERLGKFYPRPPVSNLLPLIDEYNQARKDLRTYQNHSERIVLRDPAVVTDPEIRKLRKRGDFRVLDVAGLATMPTDAVLRIIQPPTVDAGSFNHIVTVARDIDEVGGQSGETRGAATSKTATQADIMQGYGAMREDFQRNKLARAVQEAYKKLLDSMQKHMTLPISVANNGRDGALFVQQVTPDMIRGDFDVSVDVTEMMPRNSQAERQAFVGLFQNWQAMRELFAEPEAAGAILDMWQMKDIRVRDAFVRAAQRGMMAQMAGPQGQPAQPPVPGNAAEAIAMRAGREAAGA